MERNEAFAENPKYSKSLQKKMKNEKSRQLIMKKGKREREMRIERRSRYSSSSLFTSSSSPLYHEEEENMIVLVDPDRDIGKMRLGEKTKKNLIVVRNHREKKSDEKNEGGNNSSSEQTTGALSGLLFSDDDDKKDETVEKKTKCKRTRWDLVTTTTTTNKKKKIEDDEGEKQNERPPLGCTLRLEYWMRSEEMTVKKREHVAKLDEMGGYYGVEDHIEKTVFGNDPEVNVVLEENMFPYDCPPGVSHWTLWSREDMKGEEIQEWVSEYLTKHRKDVVEWNYDMNDNCSVDVPHYHVFLRVEDKEYEMKARSKPGEISYSRDERAMNECASEGGGSKRH